MDSQIKESGKQTLPNNFTKFSSPQNGDLMIAILIKHSYFHLIDPGNNMMGKIPT